MLLPNADRAIVADAKVRDYLLSSSHPIGRFKAAFFTALGFSHEQWEVLRDALLAIAKMQETALGQPSAFGQKYEIRATLTRPSGRSADVVTIWIVPTDLDFAHFVTAFPE